eukprot:jgi/Tetstr1/429127/TSEL_019089.t1
MQAYIADMEAARREAPADNDWPELDGHHGIAVLNVPLGSPEYVHAYMRSKAEELREEVDASLSKLLSAKPSRRYTHALHHHAWALLKHCMQHKAGYWLRNCLPSEVEAFAEAVDATILAAVSFDPSTYGTDTNPVVTDFLAELLHDPDPMAAEVATLSEDAVARARSRLHLPTRLKGAGIRRMATVRDAAFIGCMNAILPSYAAEMREAWGCLQAATAGHLGDADACQMEREVEAASGSQKELTAFLYHAKNSRLRNEAVPLGNTVPRDELKDLVPDAELSLPAFNVVTGSYDPRSLKSTLLEFKTMRYGIKYTAKGPLRDIMDMSEYTGMVFGTVGEVSKGVHRTLQQRDGTRICAASDEAASALSSGHQAQDPEGISCEQGLLVSPGDAPSAPR